MVTRNNLPIKLRNEQDEVYVSFYIIEKEEKSSLKTLLKRKKIKVLNSKSLVSLYPKFL